MTTKNSDESLPPGWTVKVKVRKNGRRDKYYFEPSRQLRFSSRPEVFRYLKTAQVSRPETEEAKQTEACEQPGNNMEIKKAVGEELPPGWIKEIRVTRTPYKTRKDSYYIDPVSGNVLRSMKDVHRYLTTGRVRRFAFKPRSDRSSDIGFEHDGISSPAVSKREMLAIGKAKRQIIWGQASSEHAEITEDKALCKNGEPDSCHDVVTESNRSTLPEAKDSKKSDGKNGSSSDKPISQKCTMEKGPTESGNKRRKEKNKNVNFPRRASKRLAGLQADPVLEIRPSRRVRPVACEESDEQVASEVKEASECPVNPEVKNEVKNETKSSTDPLISIGMPAGFISQGGIGTPAVSDSKNHLFKVKKVKSEDATEQPKRNSVLHPRKPLGPGVTDDKTDVKQGHCNKPPLEEILTDPCIAFAIKTLTGEVLNSSPNSEASPLPNKFVHPPAILTAPNEMRISEPETKVIEKQGNTSTSPSRSVLAGEVRNVGDDSVVEKPGSTPEMPVGEFLADPCIEFAIKTLTGEIPLDDSAVADIEGYFQQQLGCSKTCGNGSMN